MIGLTPHMQLSMISSSSHKGTHTCRQTNKHTYRQNTNTHLHINKHTRPCTHTHIQTNKQTHTYMFTYTNTHKLARTPMHSNTYLQTYARCHMVMTSSWLSGWSWSCDRSHAEPLSKQWAGVRTHTHTHTHEHAHTRAHTHTHTHNSGLVWHDHLHELIQPFVRRLDRWQGI